MKCEPLIPAPADALVSVSPDLIPLERDGQLLLMDGTSVRPLLVTEGRDKVLDFLKLCAAAGRREEILAQINDPLLLDALMDHGIVRSGASTKASPRPLEPMLGGQVKMGRAIYLLLTQYCNLRCVYCLNGDETYAKSRQPKMTETVAFKALEVNLADLAPGASLEIVFFGGEPLLNWPLAKRIITHCEEVLKPAHPDKHIKYHLTTNLTVLPPDLLDWATRYNITFLIDIDGPADIHNVMRPSRGFDSFERVCGNVRRLVEAGLRPALRTTVTSANAHRMLEVTTLHKALGGGSSAFVPLNPVNSDELILNPTLYPDPDVYAAGLEAVMASGLWGEGDLYPHNEFAQRVRPGWSVRIACGAPFGNTPTVDASGDVYACIYLVGIRRFYLGNVFDVDYPRQPVLDGMMQALDVETDAQCSGCAWRTLCGGGCPVGRLTVRGNPLASPEAVAYAERISCATAKTVIAHVLWDMARGASANLDENSGGSCR